MMKRMKRMEEIVKKTDKEAERQGLPRDTISIDTPLEDLPDHEDKEEPNEQVKQPKKSKR